MTYYEKVQKIIKDFLKMYDKEIQEIHNDYHLHDIDPEPRLLALAERYKKEVPE